jgi:HEAT repeat protein
MPVLDGCSTLENPALANQIESLISSLQSNDSSLRRSARTRLAEIGHAAFKPMMEAFREPGPTYRTRLGVLVALNEMLPEDFGRKISVSECVRTKVKPEDIQAIVDAIGVEDRTMRQYATDFLYDLNDPRAVLPLAKLAQQQSSKATASTYQAVFAIGVLGRAGAGG